MTLLQHQSPLFRLPRELRDAIYAYYAFEEEGYVYDRAAGGLHPASGRKLHLMDTCVATAREMLGAILRTNTITITPSSVEVCQDSVRGLNSRAARFECLLHDVRWTKIIMLHYVAYCATDNILDQVVERYPSIDPIFRAAFHAIRCGRDLQFISEYPHQHQDCFSASFHEAVHYMLELTSSHPSFDWLIAKACSDRRFHIGDRPAFVNGSHRKILNWKPCLWSIPSDEDLASMERYLANPKYSKSSDRAQGYRNIRWYFSATAVFLDLLRRLKPEFRKQFRSVVLREDCKSVASPAVHAEGLIKFCVENPKVQILMHAGFSSNLVPTSWAMPLPGEQTTRRTIGPTSVDTYLSVAVDWMIRMWMLPSRGMPTGSFKILLEARSAEAIELWTLIEKWATARQVLPASFQEPITPGRVYDCILMHMFSYLGCLPKAFSAVVKSIIEGTSNISIDGPCSRSWHTGPVALEQLRQMAQPSRTYRNGCAGVTILIPGGEVAYREKYSLFDL